MKRFSGPSSGNQFFVNKLVEKPVSAPYIPTISNQSLYSNTKPEGKMRHLYLAVLLATFIPTMASADQKVVLKSLEVIKASVETGVNLRKYNELITDVKVEINLFKRDKGSDSAFANKAEKCLQTYQQALVYWEIKNDYERMKKYQNAIDSEKGLQEKWKEASGCIDSLYK